LDISTLYYYFALYDYSELESMYHTVYFIYKGKIHNENIACKFHGKNMVCDGNKIK
jgi:hypothetical protein